MERLQPLSLATRRMLALLADEIQARRKLLRWSEQDLADRLGCARKTVRALESGKPSVAIGTVFEAAVLVGLDLFGGEAAVEARHAETRLRLDLLPRRIHSRKPELKDDF
ncbi:helix-turn-helix transcriptional regulator [Rhodobacter capsulatus]|uniref:helix-turn-helix transcriptional regulator n=1 Tax=Rhodobacter capsulatus TaxID=1061 RepID=UPI0003D304F6|nr:helix-turn-helix domain-containing protein [Rhodobacter capsulatus]ETD81661.1 XRE family transcriptional regulator [Rhodobacter capsulatus YW1]TQD32407.1 helix-turn-helix domain-containing protein [Rhodobacter capsulatus]